LLKLLRGEQRCKKGGKNNPFKRWDDTLYTSTNNHKANTCTRMLPVQNEKKVLKIEINLKTIEYNFT